MNPAPASSHDHLSHYLSTMVVQGASDLFLTSGAAPSLKVQGVVTRLPEAALDAARVQRLAYSVMSETEIRDFESTFECDLAMAIDGLGRFRVNVYRQRGEVAAVVRHINAKIPTLEALQLPPVLQRLCMLKSGLVLVVGAAGSGKSTTLAAMINHRNQSASGHILTVEDPMEFEHAHGRSIVNQREVGLDTHSFDEALRRGMREAPDVIMIGEIRDAATMRHAMAYAETGHLCLSTLHANNTRQALRRILNFFPETAHRQVMTDLSLNLKGVVGQRMIRGVDGKLVPALAVMLLTPSVADLIQKGQVDEVKDVMAKSNELGMVTFDQSIYALYQQGKITAEEAVEHADLRTELSLRIRLNAGHRTADPQGLRID